MTANVCVFCGSADGSDPAFAAAADALGTELAARGLGLVYGGASVGLMGRVADASLRAGGVVTGVIPEALRDREIAHEGLTSLQVVPDMHARKRAMYDLSAGFIALPGGLGTLEEVFEAATWSQLGLHRGGSQKPVVLLNIAGFWTELSAMLDATVGHGFIKPKNRPLIEQADTIAAAIDVVIDAVTNDT